MSRMRFRTSAFLLAAATLALFPRCTPAASVTAEVQDGRLVARPAARSAPATLTAGAHPLGLGGDRDGLVYVPGGTLPPRLPLVVLLHGAGSDSSRLLPRFRSALDATGVAALIPDSRGTTWDAIQGGFGRDVAF